MIFRFIAAAVLVVIGVGCAGTSPAPLPTAIPAAMTVVERACAMIDGTPITTAFQPFTTRWADALAVATSSPRISLSQPISQLQAIRRDVQFTEWPACARRSSDLLLEGMNSEISGLLVFLKGIDPDDTRRLPDTGNVTYSAMVTSAGQKGADALFFADALASMTRGQQLFGEFGTELAYASGEQPRPTSDP